MTDADGGVVILSYTLSKPPRDLIPIRCARRGNSGAKSRRR